MAAIGRTVAALWCTILAMPVLAAETPAGPSCPPPGTSEVRWIGNGLMRGGKGYVATPMGQVHYRLIRAGDGPVLVLLHQTPWSMNQFAEVQACLAERGVSSLAIDTPGYGQSDPPPGHPDLPAYADNLLPVLDALGLQRVVIAGHHTGAAIAAVFAARHADRVSGVILHGTPLYTAEERAARLAAPERPRTLAPDGSHLSDYYRYIRDYAGDQPRTALTANWSVINWYLSGANDIAHETVYRHDLEADLRAIAAPVLILSDGGDSLHANDQRAAALRPNFRYRQFSEGRAHAMMLDPARWAEIVAAFVEEAD